MPHDLATLKAQAIASLEERKADYGLSSMGALQCRVDLIKFGCVKYRVNLWIARKRVTKEAATAYLQETFP